LVGIFLRKEEEESGERGEVGRRKGRVEKGERWEGRREERRKGEGDRRRERVEKGERWEGRREGWRKWKSGMN
jgi:hypothetical protein